MSSILAVLTLSIIHRGAAKENGTEDAATDRRNRAAIAQLLAGPIQRLEIEIKDDDLEALRKEPRRYVEARIRSAGKVYRGMAVKLKGAEGSFQPVDSKPCFTINTDRYQGGERFRGLKRFHLNNAREDSSFLRQMLAGEMARIAGVPALRCTHAIVSLNGRDLGLYVLAEGYTKEFLAEFFADSSGDLYEGGFCKDIDSGLLKGQGDPKDFRAIEQLLDACRESEAPRRWAKLKAILDVDRFASFLAFEALAGVGDSYDFYRNNYRIYHDPKTHLLSFIPHSMDQPFGGAGFPIQRLPESIVGRAFVSCPEGRRLYRQRVAELYEKVWVKHDWAARVDVAARKVREAVGAELAKQLTEPMEELRGIMADRTTEIAEQLAHLPTPLEFGRKGIAQLTAGWTPKREGDAHLDRVKDHGEECLRVVAEGKAQASWRTAVRLEPGRYRFEARVRTAGVRDGAGVGLRISGRDPVGDWLSGDSDWKTVHYEFDVSGEEDEVVLVAELRAGKGEAWFAANSMQLVRGD